MLARSTRIAVALLLGFLLLPAAGRAGLAPDLDKALRESKFVYISSTRKDGTLSQPAEIWFLYHDGAVYVGTRPTSWRVRRIKAGRPDAKIAAGKVDGPSFAARGEIVKDPAVEALLLKTYARKYPEGWPKYEQAFRDGFKDGNRVVVKYAPKN